MKFPSIQSLIMGAKASFLRFPLALLFAVSGAYFAICAISFSGNQAVYMKLCFFLFLPIPLLISSALYGEAKECKPQINIFIQCLIVALTTVYYFFTPARLDDFSMREAGTLIVIILLELLALLFVPFIRSKKTLSFWQYSQEIILNVFVSGLLSLLLFGGLCLALLAVETLFDIRIKIELYKQFAAVIFGIIAVWIFLSRIPSELYKLNENHQFSSIEKVLLQYIVIPLMILYMVILYAYSMKILVTWELPQGWVSRLMLVLSIAGVLVTWMAYPLIVNEKKSRWNNYPRWFSMALLPLMILFFVAIFRRISDYGFTPSRYFLLLFAIWLTAFIGYFLFTKKRNIILISISLAVFMIISILGPLNAFSVSKRSQIHRLERLLTKCNILIDGKINPVLPETRDEKSYAIEKMLYDIRDYNDIFETLEKRWDTEFPVNKGGKINYHDVAEALNVNTYDQSYGNQDRKNGFDFYTDYSDKRNIFDVREFDFVLWDVNLYSYQSKDSIRSDRYIIENEEYTVSIPQNRQKLIIYKNGKNIYETSFVEYLETLWSRGYRFYDEISDKSTPKTLDFEDENMQIKVRFHVEHFEGYIRNDDTLIVERFQSTILIKVN